MKEAKVESEQIIAAYKTEQEKLYQEALNKVNNQVSSSSSSLDASTSSDINTLEKDFSNNKNKVEALLLKSVTDVKYDVPQARV